LVNAVNGGPFFVENSSTKINRLIDIDNEYVDNINTDSVNTVDNILSHLDPHSVYISPSEQTQVAESMKGDFVGIGVNFYMYKILWR
jgi:carboxyl-terminal processing protease